MKLFIRIAKEMCFWACCIGLVGGLFFIFFGSFWVFLNEGPQGIIQRLELIIRFFQVHWLLGLILCFISVGILSEFEEQYHKGQENL